MPRPTLQRKTLVTRKAAGVSTTAAGATVPAVAETTKVMVKESAPTLVKDVARKSSLRIAGGVKKATVAIGRVTRGGGNVEKSLVYREGERVGKVDGGPLEQQEEEEEEEGGEGISESKKVGRVTRGRGKKSDAEVKVDKKKSTKGKHEVVGESSEVEDGMVENTPVKGRAIRKRGDVRVDSVDPDLTPKGSISVPEAVDRQNAVESEGMKGSEEENEENDKEQDINTSNRMRKSRAGIEKMENKKEDKGKGRAIDEDVMEQMEMPSSPPAIPLQGSSQQGIPDDLSSTSSIYGDENFLPPPLASSTPKAGSTTTLPVTPPKPRYRSSEGYTPPPQTVQRTGGAAGPSTVAGPSLGNLSPVRRRLWESSPAPTSPHPLSQLETPKTAAVVDEGPLGFDIYEDSSPAKSPQRQDLSRVMEIDRDARGDGAGANILRTPKKNPTAAEVTKKRTSTGTKRSPDGRIIEEEEEPNDSDHGDSDTSDEEKTPKPVPVETRPKRQKRGAPEKPETVLTKDLLDLAPRRRRTGKTRTTRNKAPVVDDLGEDLTSEFEEEISIVAKKRGAGRKGGKITTATKDKGTTITKKALTKPKGKTTISTRDNTDIPTITNKSTTSMAKKSSGKIYTRSKSIPDNASDSSLTPVPADKENEFSLSMEPSSEAGTDEAGVSKAGRKKLNEIKKAFKEVDEWEMEFEDVSVEGSSEV